MNTVRKPLLKKRPTGKFKMHDFQREDIARLVEQDSSANWGEMGTMKTSTVEWLMEAKLKHIPNPRVLVITTKSGKGTYLESLPEVLPEWDVFVTSPQRTNIVVGSKPVPVDVELPDPLYMRPVVVVAHYHCFTNRACVPQQVMATTITKNGQKLKVPILQDDGTFKMTNPRCARLLNMHWDMVIVDEAHRMKNHEAQWSRNMKKLKAEFRHIMTGTGFINNPAEIYSLLNFLYPQTYTSYWRFRERFCNTPDAPIWMADLSFKYLKDIKLGDKVVGWDSTPEKPTTPGYGGERKLCESEVLAINKRIAPVVRVTLNSGRQIKCTPDHLWLSGRGKGSIDRFVSVDGERIGANQVPQLVHVIDPTPLLTTTEEEYAAAYLGSAMDCEGTWPYLAQCTVANPEVHARMLECLKTLGIPHKIASGSKIRLNGINGKDADDYVGGGAPADVSSLERNLAARQLATNFLNWCNPAKRNRIVNSIIGKGRWRLADEVSNVEFMGEYEVISMTTTTGNYIAWGYASKNCEEENWSGYRKIVGIKKSEIETFKELVRLVGVRRTMLECFPDIGEPMETIVPVELNGVQAKMYREIRDELSTMDAAGIPFHSPNVLSMLNRLRQICVATPEVTEEYYDFQNERRVVKVKLTEPSSKLDAAMELIEGLEWDEESKQQIVVFSNFKDPLELLKVRLTKAKIPFLHLQASMNDDDRYEMWHETWPKKEHQVFLCTLAVGSESINLSSAQRAIFLDQSWSPKDNSQAIGRIYRPGQTGIAQIIYIRAENTVDQKILAANDEKQGWFKSIFGGDEEEETGDEDDNS